MIVRMVGGVHHGKLIDFQFGFGIDVAIAITYGLFASDRYRLRRRGETFWLGFDGREIPANIDRALRRSWIDYQRAYGQVRGKKFFRTTPTPGGTP